MAEVFATVTSPEHVLRSVPIRAGVTTSGTPNDTGLKDGLEHYCRYFSAVANANVWHTQCPVTSCAFVPTSATTVRPDWDPDDDAGIITFAASGASTGYLHVWRFPGVTTETAYASTATVVANHGALHGDMLRVLPIRNTATAGVPQDVSLGKAGYIHRLHYIGAAANADTFNCGKPVISAAFCPEETETQRITWNPQDGDGVITFVLTGATSGWLHAWTHS